MSDNNEMLYDKTSPHEQGVAIVQKKKHLKIKE